MALAECDDGKLMIHIPSVDNAMVELEKALEVDPKNVNSIIKKASILMERAAVQEAIEAFELAERVDPADPDLYYHRGECASLFDSFDAITKPQHPTGQVRFLMQDNDNAIADYKKSLELDDNFVYAYIQLGVGQYKLGQTAKAMATFKKAAKKFKGSGEVYNYHGEILLDTQNWTDGMDVRSMCRRRARLLIGCLTSFGEL